MSDLCFNLRLGVWFIQVKRDFPFPVRIAKSEHWVGKYRDGPQPFVGLYNIFGWDPRR